MGATPRSCVKAVVLTALMSAVLSSALPACQFPNYGFTTGSAGRIDAGGMSAAAGLADSGAGGVGAGDGGDGGDGGDPAVIPFPCPAVDCVPDTVPSTWLGPIVVWEGMPGTFSAPPDCPDGYSKVNDLHHGLTAPPGDCTCTCAAQGQACDLNTTLRIFADQTCSSPMPCSTATAPQECSAVSGCIGSQGSMVAASPKPSGGTCEATVSAPAKPTWDYDVRICQATRAGVCDAPGQVCAPLPTADFPTQLCVMQVLRVGQPQPPCPPEFPTETPVLNATYDDQRGCTECGCGSVSGGNCEGSTLTLSANADCTKGQEYSLDLKNDEKCVPFALGAGNVRPTHVGSHYTVTAGTCDVATQPDPKGQAVPNGMSTVVCCQ